MGKEEFTLVLRFKLSCEGPEGIQEAGWKSSEERTVLEIVSHNNKQTLNGQVKTKRHLRMHLPLCAIWLLLTNST